MKHTNVAVAAVVVLGMFGTAVASDRWVNWLGVDNARDFGGMTTVDGMVVRTNRIYRSQAFNDNAICDWLTESRIAAEYRTGRFQLEFGRRNANEFIARIDRRDFDRSFRELAAALKRDKSLWRKGELRGTPESRRRIVAETGLRTELDLRTKSECWGMTGSPLGASVRWVNVPSEKSTFDWYRTAEGRAFFSTCFRLFLDEKNYPINIHCIAGADRTGCLAYVLEAVLGVREEEMIEDYALTSLTSSGNRPKDRIVKNAKAFDAYSGRTIHERVRAYVLECGFTPEDVMHFRKIVLAQ